MTAGITWRRWCSRRFTAVAAALLPRPESPWGDAMKAEIEAIEDDRESLRWAWGCLRTACVRRLGVGLRDHRNARSLMGTYLLLTSIAPLCVSAFGMVYHSGSRRAFDYLSQPAHQKQLLVFGSVPMVIFFLVSGALTLASALAVFNRRLRTAAELMVVWFVLNQLMELGVYLFYSALWAWSAAHLSLSTTIRAAINVCLILWLWCARSVERESLGTSLR
jgi:hypothetical protein